MGDDWLLELLKSEDKEDRTFADSTAKKCRFPLNLAAKIKAEIKTGFEFSWDAYSHLFRNDRRGLKDFFQAMNFNTPPIEDYSDSYVYIDMALHGTSRQDATQVLKNNLTESDTKSFAYRIALKAIVEVAPLNGPWA